MDKKIEIDRYIDRKRKKQAKGRGGAGVEIEGKSKRDMLKHAHRKIYR